MTNIVKDDTIKIQRLLGRVLCNVVDQIKIPSVLALGILLYAFLNNMRIK